MSVAELQPITPRILPRVHDDATWRLPGCGERCRGVRVVYPGRNWAETVPLHDPNHHEAYGEAVLARQFAPERGLLVRTGPLVLNGATGSVTVLGEETALTPREAGILFFLASRLGQLCPIVEILGMVWGPEYLPNDLAADRRRSLVPAEAHLLRVNLARLRPKLGVARHLIVTFAGRGYMLRNMPPFDLEGHDDR